ncbi:DUF488 family protein [Paraburkholderia terrae]|uniref:DUF488 domain-containing protein n=1 Tax=Paraburkholderia terrae TaxID=311230 RepID=UPI0033659CD7
MSGCRDLAPSVGLRKWFGHDAKRWDVFQQHYRNELDAEEVRERIRHLLSDADGRTITLVYGADEEHNQAIVLRNVLSNGNEG